MVASARPYQLLAQGGEGLLLGSLHGHRADLQLRRGGPQGEPFKDGEPQGCCLDCRQLLQQGVLTGGGGSIKAGVAKWPGALLMLTAGDAHQADAIAQVVLQGPGDAAAQIGPSGLACSAAGSGANQGLTGHLDQILPLHQREEAPGGSGSEGISQGQVLQHQGIAGTQGRTDERLGLLLAARGGKRGSHLGTAENPTPTGRPQRHGKDDPLGRLARSLTRREDWPREAVGVRRPGGQPLPPTAVAAGCPAKGLPSRTVRPLR